MHSDLTVSASTLLAFALVLIRLVGIFVLIPMPIKDAGPRAARILFALACTIALFPCWPTLDSSQATPAVMLGWVVSEASLGLAIGLMVSFIAEALTLGAQLLAQQAGYAYASIVDPVTQADSEVLPAAAQILAGLLFFTTGLHRVIIRVFAITLATYPPGRFTLTKDLANTVVRLSADTFTYGLRLALPIIGLLLMTDIALALVGRLNSQIHISMQAFPAKMLLTLIALVAVFVAAPILYQSFANHVFEAIGRHFIP
jgi:flagellar biosynthesis protein FliR